MIEINNLVKRYGKINAVNDITFSVNKGEVLGFLGPNGAGKTTTMNIITGYLSSTSGTVKINGYDILENPMEAKRCIGYLPEIPPLYPDMTVIEYLNFICDLKKVSKDKRKEHLAKILSMVKITDVATRLIDNLSKGYKQRVGIAQALIDNPEILILDEPTVGLDPNQIVEIRKLIKTLAKTHTIIISSHILSEIQAMCDRVVIINKGKLAAVKTINDLNYKVGEETEYLLTFVGNADVIVQKLSTISEIKDINIEETQNEISQISFKISSSNDIRSQIFYAMVEVNCPILEFRLKEKTLEEVFIDITSEKVNISGGDL